MQNKLYVGNLPDTVSEEYLRNVFGKSGTVVSINLTIPIGFKKRGGYAYIIMRTAEEAKLAAHDLRDELIDGEKIQITYAHEIDQDRSTNYYVSRYKFSKHKRR